MAASTEFKVGMLVEHPARPQWGPGKVVAVDESRLHVYFKNEIEAKAKTFMRSMAPLKVCHDQNDEVLDSLPKASQQSGEWMLPKNYEKVLSRAAASIAKDRAKAERRG
jgi:hypothetical protein